MRFVQINDRLIINLSQIQCVSILLSGAAGVKIGDEELYLSPDELAHLKAEMAKANPPDPPVEMEQLKGDPSADSAHWFYDVWEGGKRVD